MKKITILLISCLFIFNFSAVRAEELSLQSPSAILIDADSGQILFENNSHEKLPPASITKIMTMLLVMEELEKKSISLDDVVTVSKYASDMDGSLLYLEANEKRTVEELLTGVAVESANDAAVALAEYIAGDHLLFVKLMNEKAKSLGMEDTVFHNANGLPQEGHLTSAHDVALMSKELMKYPKIHEYLSIWMKDVTVGKDNDRVRTLANTNKLLKQDNRVDGIKTGYTDEAKYCLSATAKDGSMRLISVVLQAPSSDVRFEESLKLLNYGFNKYKKEAVVEANENMGQVELAKGNVDKIKLITKEGYSQLLLKSEKKEFVKELVVDKDLLAPIKKGEKLGELIIKEGEKEVYRIDLLAEVAVERISFFTFFNKLYSSFLSL